MKIMKSKPGIRLLALVLAAVLTGNLLCALAPHPVHAATSSELEEEIAQLQEDYDQMEQEKKDLQLLIGDNREEMEALVAQKAALEQEIVLLHRQLKNIQSQILAYNLLIADKQEELDAAAARLESLMEQNQQRIRAMEMYGEMSYLSVLSQAGSFGEFLDRLSMVAEIARADQRRLEQLRDAADAVERSRAALAEEKAALKQVQSLLQDAQQTLEEKKAAADALLQKLYAKGQEYEDYLALKEDESAELSQLLAQKGQELSDAKHEEYLQWLATSVPPTTTEGENDPPSHVVDGVTWVMPINYVRFSSAYGWRIHPLEGIRKFHHGVDLAAPEGTPIYATRSGVVTAAGYGSANGNYVTINHGDGFTTMYLHMTHYIVSEGDIVSAGQKIGECGNTGASKGNHLHFGIYYNGQSVNPANYINFY